MHKVPDISVMQKIPVSSVVYRIADSAPSVLISDLRSERRILYISVDDRLRDLRIEMRSVSQDTSVKGLTVHPFSDIPFCCIVSGTGHIVAAASESFGYNEDQIVSSDVIGMRYGSLFDATQTMVAKIADDLYEVQVVSWYDNENSYTSQMVRTIKYFAELG